jgi:hypothetical protein
MERPIEPHPLFGDNLGLPSSQANHPRSSRLMKASGGHAAERREEGVYDTLQYLAVVVFGVGPGVARLLAGARVVLRQSVDYLVDWAIARELADVLDVGRVVHICKLLEGLSHSH